MSATIEIHDVPDEMRREIEARAARAGLSVSDYMLREVRHIIGRPTLEEMMARLATRKPIEVSESPADAVRAERDSR